MFQTWLDKAKTLSVPATDSEKKRKRPEEDDTTKTNQTESESAAKKKKPLTQNTNAKLSSFAFSKS